MEKQITFLLSLPERLLEEDGEESNSHIDHITLKVFIHCPSYHLSSQRSYSAFGKPLPTLK